MLNNSKSQQKQEKCPVQHYLYILSEKVFSFFQNNNIFPKNKNIANLRKICFFEKEAADA